MHNHKQPILRLMLILLTITFLATRISAAEPPASFVVCAGGNEVFVLDAAAAEQGTIKKVWSWTAKVEHGLEEKQLKRFGNLDECKPLDGGKLLLVCASNSGCGLIERATGKLLWSAAVTNAHSVERLPGERIVAASSLSGDKLILFDIQGESSAKPLWSTPLKSAHGVIWDDQREVLYALGYDELRRYTLRDWKTATPALELQKTYPLPDDDGHDLRAVPASPEMLSKKQPANDLLVTTHHHVWLFDRETEKFRKHPVLGDVAKVKAVDVHPTSGRVVYSTWAQKFLLADPNTEVPVKGNTIYKVRWLVGE